ncbi:MAG: hypothetical protein SynsKO_00950 [Synoicihabitans sp.]
MNTPKRILLAHSDAHSRHLLAMLLEERGAQVTEVEASSSIESLWSESTYDLGLIDFGAQAAGASDALARMLKSQPDTTVIGLVTQLEPTSIAAGVRAGLKEVLPLRTDLKPLVNRLLTWLGEQTIAEPSAEELAEVEETLAQLESADFKPTVDPELMSQRERLWRGLRELHLEREIGAAVKHALEIHAHQLASDRAKLDLDQQNMDRELETMRAEANELDRNWRALEQQQQALNFEKQNLSKMEQDLRSQEEFVKTIAPFPIPACGPAEPSPRHVVGTPSELERGWADLERAKMALQAERSMFRDERMVLVDLDQQIRRKETRLKDLAEQIQDLDRKRKGLPLPPPKAFAKTTRKVAAPRKTGLFRNLLGGRA